jgi:beta-galactosidase
MRTLLVSLTFLSAAVIGHAQQTDLTAFEWGAMPTASAAVADMAYRPTFVLDGKAETGWVCPVTPQMWLRLEWRFPVIISNLTFTQFPTAPQKPHVIGDWVLEAREGQQWREIAKGDQSGMDAIQIALARPVRTEAVRFRILSSPGEHIGISEVKVLGEKPVLPLSFAPAWQGRWIWIEPSLFLPHREPIRRYLRRSFEVADPAQVKEAWLVASFLDRGIMYLNAKEVLRDGSYNGGIIRPARVAQVPPSLLLKGENVLSAQVEDIYEVGSQGLLAELILIGKDGSRTVIPTDDKWTGQEDSGLVPDWQEPGFKDARYVAAKVAASPNTPWHWLWRTPYPSVAPAETMQLVDLKLDPQPLHPGRPAQATLTFEVPAKPAADYAVILRLGEDSQARGHDYELWGAVAQPQEIKTSAWEPGRHTVTLNVDIPPEAPSPTPATILVSRPEGAVGVTSTLPGMTSDPWGLHLTLPVQRVAVSDRSYTPPQTGDFPDVKIKTLQGEPTLTIDGTPTAPVMWASPYGNLRRYSAYAATGVKIFRPLMEGHAVPAPGEEAQHDQWWFAQVDRMINAALAIDPQIKVIPAVWMDPNPDWLFQNSSEQFVSGRGQVLIPIVMRLPDRSQVRPTFMSQAWRKAGAEGLTRLVKHMRRQPYAPSVIGLIFFAGRAGENYYGGNELNIFINDRGQWDAEPRERWDSGDFSTAARRTFRDFLMAKYQTDAALQQAWQNPTIHFDDILEPARFVRDEVVNILTWAERKPDSGSLRDPLQPGVGTLPMDYFQCFSEAMADSFIAWGKAVKDASDNRLLTGCYYGYTLAQLFTAVPGFHGHTAVDRAARTPYLDIFVSPAEYDNSRRAGGHLWGHNITDSLRLHNKLFVYEADTRTYLSDIAPKQYSLGETLEVLKRDACAAMLRGEGWWWLEFAAMQRGAGAREWFIDPDIQKFAGQLKRVYDFQLTLPDRGPSAQIAIFYHGESHTAQDIFSGIGVNIPIGRGTLVDGVQRIGAPYDLYNLADLKDLQQSGKLNQYKLCLFLNPFYLQPEEVKLLELAKGGGRTLVWLYAPGLAQPGKHLLPENIAQTIAMTGVKLLQQDMLPTMRFTDATTPATAGLAAGYEMAPRAFLPGQTWERFGSTINPVPYLDPAQSGDAKIIGRWVMDGQVRPDLGAFAIRKLPTWTSVYSACPYLSIELMRNLAKMAGVHVYRDADDILYADRHFVCLHTGAEAAQDTLRLPQATPVYEVFSGKLLSAKADSVKLEVPPYTTVLYYLGDPAKLEAVMR